MTNSDASHDTFIKEEPGGIISVNGKPLILVSATNIPLSDAGIIIQYVKDAVIDFYQDKAMSMIEDMMDDGTRH